MENGFRELTATTSGCKGSVLGRQRLLKLQAPGHKARTSYQYSHDAKQLYTVQSFLETPQHKTLGPQAGLGLGLGHLGHVARCNGLRNWLGLFNVQGCTASRCKSYFTLGLPFAVRQKTARYGRRTLHKKPVVYSGKYESRGQNCITLTASTAGVTGKEGHVHDIPRSPKVWQPQQLRREAAALPRRAAVRPAPKRRLVVLVVVLYQQ